MKNKYYKLNVFFYDCFGVPVRSQYINVDTLQHLLQYLYEASEKGVYSYIIKGGDNHSDKLPWEMFSL